MNNSEDLFALSVQHFQTLKSEFGRYGLSISPDLELRPGEGLLCYYNLSDGHIYLSLPDTVTARGKLQLMVLRSLFNCETNDEVIKFLNLISYWLIAHEMAHHFRHARGLLGDNLWQEEQIANQLALAVVKRHMSSQDRAECKQYLRRALKGLSQKIGAENIGSDSYYSLLYSLNAAGTIDDNMLRDAAIMQKLLAVPSEDILRNALELPLDVMARIEKRQVLIDDINNQGHKDLVCYLYYYLSWMNLGLSGRETNYVGEFAQRHLNQTVDLLPPNDLNLYPTSAEILACYSAYQETQKCCPFISMYFYKRYRTLLISKCKAANALHLANDGLAQQAYQFLDHWNYQGIDPLFYIFDVVPPEIQHLLPQCISPEEALHNHLSDTDRRLRDYTLLHTDDLGAGNSYNRLELFNKFEFYNLLTAEDLLQLIQTAYSVRLAAEETLIWQGDKDSDVFVLVSGRLEVLKSDSSEPLRIVLPGELIGEIAYFAQTERTATVRALEESQCLVMKSSDLYLFCQESPAFTLQMAHQLAKKF